MRTIKTSTGAAIGTAIIEALHAGGCKAVATFKFPGDPTADEWTAAMRAKGIKVTLAECDVADYAATKAALAEVEAKDHVRNFQPPITGEDVMKAFAIPPSKPIGDIKTAIKDAILDGQIQNDRQQAWGLMVQEGLKLGLSLQPGFEQAPPSGE